MATKECKLCKIAKILDEFHRDKSKKDGRRNECKECANRKKKENHVKRPMTDAKRAYAAEYRCKNKDMLKEKNKEYMEKNKETILEKARLYAQNNKGKNAERRRKYKENNKEKINKYSEEYRLKNKEKIKAYFEANSEKIKEQKKKYYEENKETFKEYNKKYFENNREQIIQKQKEYYQRNKERIKEYLKDYNKKNKNKIMEKKKIYHNYKLETDPIYNINNNIRTYVRKTLTKDYKPARTEELLGCKINDFKKYLEDQFDENMNWDNYGKYWQVDHILPVVYFNMVDPVEQKICWNYMNLRPCEASENLRKSGSLSEILPINAVEL